LRHASLCCARTRPENDVPYVQNQVSRIMQNAPVATTRERAAPLLAGFPSQDASR